MSRKSINSEISLTPAKKLGRSPTEDITKSLPQPKGKGDGTPRRKSIMDRFVQILDSPQTQSPGSSRVATTPVYHPNIQLRDTHQKRGRNTLWGCPFKEADGSYCAAVKPSPDKQAMLDHYWVKCIHVLKQDVARLLKERYLNEHTKAVHKRKGFPCLFDDCERSGLYSTKNCRIRANLSTTHMIAHFAEHGCFWTNVQCRGVLGLSNKSDLDLVEAYYQFFGEGTNRELGGHNMRQETGLRGRGIKVHSNTGDDGEEIPLDLKIRMWMLADQKMLWDEEITKLTQANADLKRPLFPKKTEEDDDEPQAKKTALD